MTDNLTGLVRGIFADNLPDDLSNAQLVVTDEGEWSLYGEVLSDKPWRGTIAWGDCAPTAPAVFKEQVLLSLDGPLLPQVVFAVSQELRRHETRCYLEGDGLRTAYQAAISYCLLCDVPRANALPWLAAVVLQPPSE